MAQNLGQVNLQAASAHARDVVALSSHLLQFGFLPLHSQSGYFIYVHPHHHNNAYIIMSPFQNSLYMISVVSPSTSYQSQNNYQDLAPTYSTPIGAEGYYHYNSNPSFTPSRRTNNARWEAYHQDHDSVHDFINIGPRGRATARAPSFVTLPNQDHIMDNQIHNVELMEQGNQYVQESNDGYFRDYDSDWNTEEEEALIMDAIQLLGRQNPTTHYNGVGLSEGVISMCLKTRNGDEHDKSEICTVCQDDLCQEDEMVGVLDCGHEYHAKCIKQWLQEKNICPLCKTIALPYR
ncbi:hypothetical protein BUALT_Bualt05G0084700 [Buddleja alternifolia]|uniref:RING-type E3 ubiquitin transferase n=1 Tax=Buddleja alternifolia TaxID=168488 RepID=A0AAV6XJ41_9LAMI|nr:hypothetical protein BUALT_Bualt05G0084700 [Buddleja alternifolia]